MAKLFNRVPSIAEISIDSNGSYSSTSSDVCNGTNRLNLNSTSVRESTCSPNKLNEIYNDETKKAKNKIPSDVNEIQELQNLMEIQNDKLNEIKSTYSQQNSKLAKTNSALMMKVSGLEKIISDLVKENIVLRSQTISIRNEQDQKLEETLQVLENGLYQKFDEIFYMINNIRRKENLPTSSGRKLNSKDATRYSYRERSNTLLPAEHRRSFSQLKDITNIESNQDDSLTKINKYKRDNELFITEEEKKNKKNNDNNNDNSNDDSNINKFINNENTATLPKKRRKSSRRESFVFTDEQEFLDAADHNNNLENNNIIEDSIKEIRQIEFENNKSLKGCVIEKINEEPELTNTTITHDLISSESESIEQEIDNNPPENSFTFTNSIIEYSIPEEATSGQESNSNIFANSKEESASKNSSASSSQKLQIFNDSTEDNKSENINDLSSSLPFDKSSNQPEHENMFIQLPSQNKIKHSMKPARLLGKKKIVDEIMPINASSVIDELPNTRQRRTRGKAVDYKLPSLRAKMRRPTEGFVDATTVIDIHDLQVNSKGKKNRRSKVFLGNTMNLPIKIEDTSLKIPDISSSTTDTPSSDINHVVGKQTVNTPENNKICREKESSVQEFPKVEQNNDFININKLKLNSWPNDTSPLLKKTQFLLKKGRPSKTIKKPKKINRKANSMIDLNALNKKQSLNTILDTDKSVPITLESLPLPNFKNKNSALQDVTNTRSNKPTKTKVLFKKPIVNNFHDENSAVLGEVKFSKDKDVSSFRLNEEDLSVFDFMGLNKKKSTPKTYRIYNRK
ncbi:hypothetical protein TPHA_0J01440 [Tetrapisispora phaffii CBS 4417]|uniref:Shugoshin C-terminal domain-containing protein n=1 Tax=Tetrapisispora phaffii (strain ATCC 24235 / CBS 4417 / NBRC 1672 / NRRL Y-8282 / UCD 70-5) TaxID=1071381 RepID=G8BYM4_TETPH|nr:hypothetical protein TPHA_0J01440 [Tetrapisispora phaffii CBS 4417]CCE64966.1 hypothetical protein TPHA_0J01440 [Tetrapisispora phaffii CBS 4417]